MNDKWILLLLTTLLFYSTTAFTFANHRNTSISTRLKRQTSQKCPSNSELASSDLFKCKSGECINEDQECDGKVDCQDGSDESNSCLRLNCQPFLFVCRYGACIEANLKCNGFTDCRDGSDEIDCGSSPSRTSACNEEQFECSNGECIDSDFKCDGQAQCKDASDESSATCSSMQCPLYTFKCAYGACVNGNSKCNGITECYDGSDEYRCPGTTTPPTQVQTTQAPPLPNPVAPIGSCTLPNHPDHGRIYHFSKAPEGKTVADGAVIRIVCNNNYKRVGDELVYCNNGLWNVGIATCLKLCRPIYSQPHMRVTCNFNGVKSENCSEPVSGTIAQIKCDPYFEDIQFRSMSTRHCHDGTWNYDAPKCVPVCGQKSVQPQTLIVDGTVVKKGDFPWQAALYRKQNKKLICGGSLISPRVVISAAHCVTTSKGELKSKDLYEVAVGKYYRNYSDSRDKDEAQFSSLYAIFVDEYYRANAQKYLGDIALLVTTISFEVGLKVQPVCLDRTRSYDLQLGDPSIQGYVTGWGYTKETGNPSEILKELKLPAVNNTYCKDSLAKDFEDYLTPDKLCAGFLNKSTNVCSGDSGGGLVFRNGQNGRFYLTGIVSLSPQSETNAVEGCNSQTFALYTNVSRYIDHFIVAKEQQFYMF